MGIIDTLTAAFDLVRRKPWLAVLPIILNVAVWAAPRLSIDALLPGLMSELAKMTALSTGAGSGPDLLQALQRMAPNLNMAWLFQASAGYVGLPSLPPAPIGSFFGLARPAIPVPEENLLALCGALLLAGFLVGTTYLALIAQEVRDGHADGRRLASSLPRYWLRLLGAFLFIVVGFPLLVYPLFLIAGPLAAASPTFGVLLLFMASVLSFWVVFYLAFVPEAIVFGETGVLRAIAHSITIVRANLLSAFVLLMLVLVVIPRGFGAIWMSLMTSTTGALVAIVANAFIGTGLTAALVIYYRERLRALQALLEQQRSPA